MIKNIIFDIGNVLTDFRWQEFFAGFGYEDEVLKRLAKATVGSTLWDEVDRGVWSDEELIEGFIQNDPSLEPELLQIFTNIHGMVTKRGYAIPWIQSLQKAGYRCYYLSNFSHKAHTECADALDFLEYMDGGILSYQDKMIKPDRKIYQLLLNRYGLKAQECVFLDDTQKNISAAAELGIHTILFQDREQAVLELEKLGVSTA
ncbi:MAG: HAD family phosphatase [Lachnospiraceae bacterium]|nr:HAD family phosphatase [Lachnospiraceae bacterium]